MMVDRGTLEIRDYMDDVGGTRLFNLAPLSIIRNVPCGPTIRHHPNCQLCQPE